MAKTFCALCGKSLPKGKLKYIVHINIFSDFDDTTLYVNDDSSEELYELLEEGDSIGHTPTEDTVNQELSLYLCVECKQRFARDIVEGEEEDLNPHKKDMGIVYH